MRKLIVALGSILINLLLFSSNSFGFGVSTPFYLGRPLTLAPGSSYSFDIMLTGNWWTGQGEWAKVYWANDAGIASFMNLPADGLIYIDAGEQFPIGIEVTIPEYDYLSDYMIMPSAVQALVESCDGGDCMISMGAGVTRLIPVHVDAPPPPIPTPEPSTFILLGAGLAGLVVWRRKRS